MKSSRTDSRIIPKEESSEFQTWSLPQVTSREDGALAETVNVPMLTAEQLEEIQQQAHEEGYQEGQQRGYDEGFAKGLQDGQTEGHKQALDASLEEIQQQTFHFDQLFKSLEQPFSQVSEQVEYEISSLALAVAKQVIQQEIKSQPETLIPLVKKSLFLLPSSAKRVKIFLHPEDLKLIKNAFELSDELSLDDYHLHEDISLKRGGCVIDTDISHIDASLDKRLSDIATSLIPKAPDLPSSQTPSPEQAEENVQTDTQNNKLAAEVSLEPQNTANETLNTKQNSNDEYASSAAITEPHESPPT